MPPQPGAMRNRWAAYAVLSTTLAAGVILKSLAQRPNFYSAAVYLSQSSANLMIICNLVFVTACSILLSLQKVLYGPLRPIEIEQLYEKAWFAVTETCLAMTIFRGEIGAWFLVMFFSLLAGKVWGWIGEGRVEVLEQQQHGLLGGHGARLFHTRLALSLALSVLFDMSMLEYVVGQVLHMARPDMMVMFGFEFAVLTITSLSTALRYALNLVEIGIVRDQKQKRIDAIRKSRVEAALQAVQSEQDSDRAVTADLTQRRTQAAEVAAQQPIDEADVEVEGWEGKGRWIFYLDLTTDFCKLVVYLSFFFILLIFYGLPLHIMRDVFLTCRSFFKRIGDFLRYRTATRDMNERYPDATETEIRREDVCIICREEMRPYVPVAQGAAVDPVAERMRPKKLPCGHVLHFSCLRSWLERQQICPTCRATVVPNAQPQPAAGAGAQVPQAAQGNAGGVQQPHNGGNGRPRVYQFGPLRIGVGAARGNDMFEELEQQLANIPPAAPGANIPPQQYGIGIRWDGIRRRAQGNQTHRSAPQGLVQNQLNAAERQIQRELDSLQASMGELQALRNVQAQLARIRMARQAAALPPQPAPPALPQANPFTRPAIPTVTNLVSSQQQNVLRAGSDQLPEGITLPAGWSMMPLQHIQTPAQAVFSPMPMPMPMPMPGQMPGIPQMPMMGAPGPHLHVHHTQHMAPNVDIGNTRQNTAAPPLAPTQGHTANEFLQNAQRQNGYDGSRSLETTNLDMANRPASSRNGTTGDSEATDSTGVAPSSTQSETQQPAQQPRSSTVLWSSHVHHPQIPTVNASVARPSSPTAVSPSPRPSTNSSARASTTINPPSRLTPTNQTPGTNGVRSSSRSPHRPTRSIGSSWGFSGAENTNDDEDEETTDSDEDDDDDEEENRTPNTNGGARSAVAVATAGSSVRDAKKEKNATVEDSLDDPD